MELYNAIKTVIDLQGKDILKDIRLLNILSDFNAYEDMPASKYLIKNMVNKGLMAELLMESQTFIMPLYRRDLYYGIIFGNTKSH